MITTMKYRLKPTKTQVAVMYRTLDVCRETYNLSLETKVVAYENSKAHLSNFDLTGMYTQCMFVPVVDSSATEMSTRGVILLTRGSDELKSRYTLLKYNTATETSGNSRLWRHEPLRQ